MTQSNTLKEVNVFKRVFPGEQSCAHGLGVLT